MCGVIKTFPSCTIWGHRLDGDWFLERQLCEEGNTKGYCEKKVEVKMEPEFNIPFCAECDKLEGRLRSKVRETLNANKRAGYTVATVPLSDSLATRLRGRPMNADRAPKVPAEDITQFLREYAVSYLPEADLQSATNLILSADKNATYLVATWEAKAEQFVAWFVQAYKMCTIEAALTIAEREGDAQRIDLLKLLEKRADVAMAHRSLLESLGMWGIFLAFSGIGEPMILAPEDVPLPASPIFRPDGHEVSKNYTHVIDWAYAACPEVLFDSDLELSLSQQLDKDDDYYDYSSGVECD